VIASATRLDGGNRQAHRHLRPAHPGAQADECPDRIERSCV